MPFSLKKSSAGAGITFVFSKPPVPVKVYVKKGQNTFFFVFLLVLSAWGLGVASIRVGWVIDSPTINGKLVWQ